jgi:hypothetical protein
MPAVDLLSRRALLAASGASLLGGCASLDPRQITLSQTDLQKLVERQFPRQQRLMELLDVSLTNPVIKLVPERNRLATTMDLQASERISGRALRGSLAIDHSLRFEPSDATVRLANVKVEDMKLELAGTPLSGQAVRLAALLAERALDNLAIYRVSEEKRQSMARAGVNNANVAVTASGIELRFFSTR